VDRVRGLLLTPLPPDTATDDFADWATNNFIQAVAETAAYVDEYTSTKALRHRFTKYFRAKGIKEKLEELTKKLDDAERGLMRYTGTHTAAGVDQLQVAMSKLALDMVTHFDILAVQLETSQKRTLEGLQALRDDTAAIKQQLDANHVGQAKALAEAANQKAVAALAEPEEVREVRAYFATRYAECKSLYEELMAAAGVALSDGAKIDNALRVARWVEANGDAAYKVSEPFRHAARQLLQIAREYRGVLDPACQLAEAGNLFCLCAPLDAVNWKRIKAPRYNHLRLNSFTDVLLALAAPANDDQPTLSLLAHYVQDRSPYSERDFDGIVNPAREFLSNQLDLGPKATVDKGTIENLQRVLNMA